jgi:hypothetical protein
MNPNTIASQPSPLMSACRWGWKYTRYNTIIVVRKNKTVKTISLLSQDVLKFNTARKE